MHILRHVLHGAPRGGPCQCTILEVAVRACVQCAPLTNKLIRANARVCVHAYMLACRSQYASDSQVVGACHSATKK